MSKDDVIKPNLGDTPKNPPPSGGSSVTQSIYDSVIDNKKRLVELENSVAALHQKLDLVIHLLRSK